MLFFSAAELTFYMKKYDLALADYNKALELNPNNNNAKKNRQRVLYKMKK